jgi:hypothetical protein
VVAKITFGVVFSFGFGTRIDPAQPLAFAATRFQYRLTTLGDLRESGQAGIQTIGIARSRRHQERRFDREGRAEWQLGEQQV